MDLKLFCLLSSLLAILLAVSAESQSRNNDTAEIKPPLNATKQWSTSLVSAPNPMEEHMLLKESQRDVKVSNLNRQSQIQNDTLEATLQPEVDNSDRDVIVPDLEEDILNMEQNRDQNFNENLNKVPTQEAVDNANLALEKQSNNNTSMNSPVEEGILGAENDRDESMTDIFQSGGYSDQIREHGSEYKIKSYNDEKSNDEPKFEFLIAANPVQLSTTKVENVAQEVLSTRKPFVPPKSAWPVPQAQFLTTEPKLNATSATPFKKFNPTSGDAVDDYAELVEVAKNSSVESVSGLNNKTAVFGLHGNGNKTEHYVDNEGSDSSFTDLQTLFLACFATLVPLFMVLMVACGLRMAWRRYRRGGRRGLSYGSGLRSGSGDGSADPITDKGDHSNDLKSAESGFSTKDCESKEMTGNSITPTQQNPPANGSIITMTMKNNHLIVETEVRDDIIQGSRETKMKYSSNNDGAFVVEVKSNSHPMAQGSPERRALIHHSPIGNVSNSIAEESHESLESVQQPSSKQIFGSTNTGLSTSDLSLSSSGSHNPSYAYGNQIGYEHGQYGYPVYAGYVPPPVTAIPCESSREPLISKTPTDNDKPIVTAAIFKQDSILSSDDVIKSGEYNIEGSTDGPLLSDIQAREVSLHKLQDKLIEGTPKLRVIANSDSVPTSDSEDDRQEQKSGNGPKEQTVVEINHDKTNHHFSRADSLPPRLIHEQTIDSTTNNIDNNFDIIEEESSMDCYPGDIASGSPLLCHSAGIAAANARHKRASLPIITPDLYSSIKQTTKSILPHLSPKFEKLNNESSLLDSCERQSGPLIAVTEEADGAETDANDSVQE